ncbi:MAG: DUF542 domain-containing protein [Chitinophagaceae bacterium]
MFLKEMVITPASTVAEIVSRNYRTADIFGKYGITYCCGARWPLSTVCQMKGIEEDLLIKELINISRVIELSPQLPFHKWNIDFLIDYIVNVHHSFLKENLPPLKLVLTHFAEEHVKKYPYLTELLTQFNDLQNKTTDHLRHEEEVIFPYIKQVFHASADKDSLAGLLVKTLRKPVKRVLEQEEEIFLDKLYKLRELTGNYTPPENACTSHRVTMLKLKELDNDLTQHIYLEKDILFPKMLNLEAELLGR